MNLDDKICYCFHVSRRKLENWARIHAPKVASQLALCGGAGTGCGWCVPFLKQIFKRYEASKEAARAAAPGDEIDALTPEEYAARRAEYVRAAGGAPPATGEPPPDAPPQE